MFEELLERDGSVSFNNRNNQVLASKMFKVNKCLSPLQSMTVFSHYLWIPLRYFYHKTKNIFYIGPLIWEIFNIYTKIFMPVMYDVFFFLPERISKSKAFWKGELVWNGFKKKNLYFCIWYLWHAWCHSRLFILYNIPNYYVTL